MKKTIFLKIFGSHLILTIVLAAAVLAVSFRIMRHNQIDDQSTRLRELSEVLKPQILPLLGEGRIPELDGYCKSVSRSIGVRITVIGKDGIVLASSEGDPSEMDIHAYRPEIFSALQGHEQLAIRRSSTVKEDMLYAAFPLSGKDGVSGVLRLSVYMRNLDSLVSRWQKSLARTVALLMIVVLLASALLARGISGPIRETIKAARKVAAGDLNAKVSFRNRGELGDFARSFNAMTSELKGTFDELAAQKEELAAVLSSIQEGLLVIDKNDRILLTNRKLNEILKNDALENRRYWEVIRSSRFTELIRRVKAGGDNGEEEISLDDKTFLGSASCLPSRDKVVVTLHDLTEFRNIEKIKKDFILNVSHELRTPLAAIKGFVEAIEPPADAESRGYLGIIKRNTERMINIVEDLLRLSELEEKGAQPEMEAVDMRNMAENVLKLFEPAAGKKGLRLELSAPEGLAPLKADPYQMEQVLINLVDNAVKYTEKGRVSVSLGEKGDEFLMSVSDTGIGIPADHLPHLFERFYVVDRSRSRKLGGTGLGLCIVKHIVLLHGGRFSAESRVGEGTTVSIALPREG